MQTNIEIKETIKERMKNCEKQFVFGMSAILFIVPMITLSMPTVFYILQFVVLLLMYPYLKMIYNNAKGKTIEIEDCINFKGYGKYLLSCFFVLLNLCSYLLPYVLAFGVQLLGMFLEQELLILIGELLVGVYTILFGVLAMRFILVPFYLIQYEEDDLSASRVVDKCKDLMNNEYKALLKFIVSFILLFIIQVLTLNIASCVTMPFFFSCLAAWFYNHEFGKPLPNYYDVVGKDINSNIDIRQQNILREQQANLQISRQQSLNSYNQGLNNVNNFNNQQNNVNKQNNMNNSYYNQNQQMPNNHYSQQNMQGQYGYNNGQSSQQRQPYNQNQMYGQNNQPYRQNQQNNPYYNPYGQR